MTLLERILKDNNIKYTKGIGNDYIIIFNEEPLMLLDQNGSTMLEVIAKANGIDYANIDPQFNNYEELSAAVEDIINSALLVKQIEEERGVRH